ncbi:hypothetical protein N864_03675 [Intrasporangium chromatireducens Q5-1]|uniref:Uncharacterized protein n=1 Tax=Intrasporangium chromatireducens Q5-1 TaxID=584657 RepID=W9GKH2_9MICO|nr:hypothetical protein N864_03675 [Intrasporangium chromatireducens Q5-1]
MLALSAVSVTVVTGRPALAASRALAPASLIADAARTQGPTTPADTLPGSGDQDPAHSAPPAAEPKDHSRVWAATTALLLTSMLALWLRDRARRKDSR